MMLSMKQGRIFQLFDVIVGDLARRLVSRQVDIPAKAGGDKLQLERLSYHLAKDIGLERQWEIERDIEHARWDAYFR